MPRLFPILLLVVCLVFIASGPVLAQTESVGDEDTASTTSDTELTESLKKALGELVRATEYMKMGKVDQAVAKYMEAFSIDENIRWYDDAGVLNEALRRFALAMAGGGGGMGEDARKLAVKLKSAEIDIEQLNRDKERLEAEVLNLQERLDETSQEYEDKIAAIEKEMKEMHHKRNFWRGRYLRKEGYGYDGASQDK